MNENTEGRVLIRVQATPNPSAWKFVVNRMVKTQGKVTYSSSQESQGLLLASSLFGVSQVTQVHLFRNVITVTHTPGLEEIERWKDSVCAVLQTRLPVHDPSFTIEDEKSKKRENLDPELRKIDEILERTIRPGLQGDGGDIEVVSLEGNRLTVRYEGACGSCPSATTGTLMAIEGILQDEYSPEIEVTPVF